MSSGALGQLPVLPALNGLQAVTAQTVDASQTARSFFSEELLFGIGIGFTVAMLAGMLAYLVLNEGWLSSSGARGAGKKARKRPAHIKPASQRKRPSLGRPPLPEPVTAAPAALEGPKADKRAAPDSQDGGAEAATGAADRYAAAAQPDAKASGPKSSPLKGIVSRRADLSVLVADLAGDTKGEAKKQIIEALEGQFSKADSPRVRIVNYGHVLKADDRLDPGGSWLDAHTEGQEWLAAKDAVLLVWGTVSKGPPRTLKLHFMRRELSGERASSGFVLSRDLELHGSLGHHEYAAISGVAAATAAPSAADAGAPLSDLLEMCAESLQDRLAESSESTAAPCLAALLYAFGLVYADIGKVPGRRAWLEEAVEAFRIGIKECARGHMPLQWAAIQCDLGLSLTRLAEEDGNGEEEGGEQNNFELRKEAVSAYREALKEYRRDDLPLHWGSIQGYLGRALPVLGEGETGNSRLEEAVSAYRDALKEWTRDRDASQWAFLQNQLGDALWSLGERENGSSKLEQAVSAYRDALEERKREQVPLLWAATLNNLGVVLQSLGEREGSAEQLKSAIECFRDALEERLKSRVPLQWAMTVNNLGNALASLGEREQETALLEEAIAMFRKALEVRKRDKVPLEWATTQNNLGTILQMLGEQESGTERLNQAIEAYREALKERTRERAPLDWAATQNNLGNALWSLGEREGGTAALEEAVDAFKAALEVFELTQADYFLEMARHNLLHVRSVIEDRKSARRYQVR